MRVRRTEASSTGLGEHSGGPHGAGISGITSERSRQMERTIGKRRKVSAIAALFCLLSGTTLSLLFPNTGGMMRAAGVLACALILWITECVPISVSSLLLLAILPFLGLMDIRGILSNFGTNTALFIMASGALTAALAEGEIPSRITARVFSMGGERPAVLVLCMGIAVAVFSAFVSSLATCALFSALTASALSEAGIEKGRSNLGRDLMMVIPACAGIGGFMSPAGTPANILVMDLLAERGTSVSFLQWCAVGFPIGLIASVLFVLSVLILFPPETVRLPAGLWERAPIRARDRKALCIMIAVVLCWMAGSFVPSVNTTLIALIGMGILFLPGIDLMDMHSFSRGVNWDLVLAMGTVSVLMTAISDTGLMKMISGAAFRGFSSMPTWLLPMMLSLCICAMRAFIPTTTAVIALFAPMLLALPVGAGLSDGQLMLMLSFWAASALLLVYTEPIYLISYKSGYFSAGDLLRAGAMPSLLMAAAVSAMIGVLIRLAGI